MKLNGVIRENSDESFKNYILGLMGQYVRKDPKDPDSGHDFFNSMLVYNEYAKKNPELKLPDKYINILKNQLEIGDCFDLYPIFESISAQLKVEKFHKEGFTVDNKTLIEILRKLGNSLEANKEYLEKYFYMKGMLYPDGVYGYINEAKGEVLNQINK